jgi:hypothetical protein
MLRRAIILSLTVLFLTLIGSARHASATCPVASTQLYCDLHSCSYLPWWESSKVHGEGYSRDSTIDGWPAASAYQFCLERSSWSGYRTFGCSPWYNHCYGYRTYVRAWGCLSGKYNWHSHGTYRYCSFDNPECPGCCGTTAYDDEDSAAKTFTCSANASFGQCAFTTTPGGC